MSTVTQIERDAEDAQEECDSSVDTQDAFMEMLGLSACPTASLDVIDDIVTSNRAPLNKLVQMQVPRELVGEHCTHVIDLPPKCSRQHLKPSSCLALSVDNVLSKEQCQHLIEMAGSGFRYITEATHKAPDGTSHTVKLQNPNPHKLAAIDTSHDGFAVDGDVVVDDVDLGTSIMNQLFSTISDVLNSHPSFQLFSNRTKCGTIRGLNPRMRILRYDAEDDDRFEAHFDATTFVPDSSGNKRRQSLITVLVYLNDGGGKEFEGGETLYLDYHNSASSMSKSTRYDENNVVKVVPEIGRIVLFEHDLFHSGAPLKWGTKYIMRTDVLYDEAIQSIDGDEESCSENNNPTGSMIVSDICKELQLADGIFCILEEMDLLYITCESFLSPGITLLKRMLIDGGIDEEIVRTLVHKVMKAVS